MDFIPTNEQLHDLREACAGPPHSAEKFFIALGCGHDITVISAAAAGAQLPTVRNEHLIAAFLGQFARQMSLAGIADQVLSAGKEAMPLDLYESLEALAGVPPHPLAAVRCVALLSLLRDPNSVREFRPLATAALTELINQFPALAHPRWQYRLPPGPDSYGIRGAFVTLAVVGNQDVSALFSERREERCVVEGVGNIDLPMQFEIGGNVSERRLYRTLLRPEALRGLMNVVHLMPEVLKHASCEQFMGKLIGAEATMCWANDSHWSMKEIDVLPVTLRAVAASALKEAPTFRREFSAGVRYGLRKAGLDEPGICTKRIQHFLDALVELKPSWALNRLDAARIAASELFGSDDGLVPVQSQLRPWQASPPVGDCIGVFSTFLESGLSWSEVKSKAEACGLHEGWAEAAAAMDLKLRMEQALRSAAVAAAVPAQQNSRRAAAQL